MKNSRNYNFKDVDMLLTASAILETAIANKELLQKKRSNWADPFFDTLKEKIDHTLQTYLGIDSAKHLRQATALLKTIQVQALSDLSEVKVQLMEDFKTQKELRDELLKQLGFTNYLKPAQKRTQEALINLLYQFKLNLTPVVKKQLLDKTGVTEKLLNGIVGYADNLKNANVGQELNKGNRRTITQEALKAFNDIYDSIISISKIARNFYKDDQVIKDQFNYTKIAKGLNSNSKLICATRSG